jgi:hypothetical protein
MKLRVLLAWIVLSAAASQGALAEFSPRGGVPNFLAKAEGTGAVRVAYFGGSITAAEGWRPKTLKWFQTSFPGAKFSEINAAIGGTGSDLGVFRLRHDVLEQRPDLMFVEFAVNDAGASREQIHRAMEGIVRQTWRELPECDICFVYTIAGNMLETTQSGKLPRSVAAMEELAQHYSIPSINFGLEVAKLEKDGKLVFKADQPTNETQRAAFAGKMIFSSDAVHPHAETGHELYLQSVKGAFEQMRREPGKAQKHAPGAPLREDNWEQAKMVPLRSGWMSGHWTRLDPTNRLAKSFARRVPELWRGEPGAALSFRFRGTTASVYDLLGPDCGQIRLALDGKEMGLRPRFDSFSTYHRLGMVSAGSGLSNAAHEVKFTVAAEELDKVKILSQRNEKIDSAARFAGKNWYPGALLVVGEVE